MTLFLVFIILKVGGSLKKHNSVNLNMLLIGIIIPILVFFAIVNVVYAYFTAKPLPIEGSTGTGTIILQLTDGTETQVNSIAKTDSTKLVPGDTLSVVGTIENAGTAHFYVVFEFEVKVKKESESEFSTVLSSYYTIVDDTATEITVEDGVYSATAFVIEAANDDKTNEYTKDFEISYIFDGETYDNDYKNASVEYTLKISAIQKDALESSAHATELLLRYYAHKKNCVNSTYTYLNCPTCNPQTSE